MPQLQLPFFPEGVTHMTPVLAFRREAGRVVYFNGNADAGRNPPGLGGGKDQPQAGGEARPARGIENALWAAQGSRSRGGQARRASAQAGKKPLASR